jgi:hypothetical protein
MEKKWDYCYPSGLEKTLCKWDTYVPLVTKGFISVILTHRAKIVEHKCIQTNESFMAKKI